MKPKLKLIAYVRAINLKGEEGFFELEKPSEKQFEPQDKEKELFFGEKFKGRLNNNDACDFVVVEVKSIKCVPEPFYLSVLNGLEKGTGFIRLGNYDCAQDIDPNFRKSPLTYLTVKFELWAGEGIIFRAITGCDDSFKWTKTDYVVTLGQEEIWTLPKSEWELHLSPVTSVDYEDPYSVRDSLPELKSWF